MAAHPHLDRSSQPAGREAWGTVDGAVPAPVVQEAFPARKARTATPVLAQPSMRSQRVPAAGAAERVRPAEEVEAEV